MCFTVFVYSHVSDFVIYFNQLMILTYIISLKIFLHELPNPSTPEYSLLPSRPSRYRVASSTTFVARGRQTAGVRDGVAVARGRQTAGPGAVAAGAKTVQNR